jgi:Arc/MetJ family transcription regulator
VWGRDAQQLEDGPVDDDARVAAIRLPAAVADDALMRKPSHMATNLAIDDRLLDEARKVGGHKTKKATVTEALTEYIQRRKQRRILDLFGRVSFDGNYDYKAQRRRR